MTVTATAAETLKSVLDEANPNRLADALRKVALGTLLTPAKLTLTGLTGATHNITDAAHGSNPAILSVVSLRATAATTAASVGSYAVTDAGGTVLSPTASSKVGFAKLSDDGATLTFATGDVTAFVLEYIPRSANDITAAFARS